MYISCKVILEDLYKNLYVVEELWWLIMLNTKQT